MTKFGTCYVNTRNILNEPRSLHHIALHFIPFYFHLWMVCEYIQTYSSAFPWLSTWSEYGDEYLEGDYGVPEN